MTQLLDELNQQPQSLRRLTRVYQETGQLSDLSRMTAGSRWVLTGMGASYHAACIGALYLNRLGVPAVALEATDLTHYASALKSSGDVLVYLSQSGSSGEVLPFLDALPAGARVVGVTNQPDSPLARRAQWTLAMEAGDEQLIASKTYINSLALLWLLARQAAGVWDGSEWAAIADAADRVEAMLSRCSEISAQWIEKLGQSAPLLFLGHGPHAVTARQAAMVVSEWPKLPAMHSGIGAFRHGFIETVQPGLGAVVFCAPGQTCASARALAGELAGYRARVLVVENGLTGDVPPSQPVDEFLSPLLDMIPVQLFADGMAARLNVPSGFRYISKVVTQL